MSSNLTTSNTDIATDIAPSSFSSSVKQYDPSDTRFSLPLEEFEKLPENQGTNIIIGAIIPRPPPPPSTSTSGTDVDSNDAENGEKEILMIKRALTDSEPDHWEIPGGTVEPNESILQGILREIQEETGLKCSVNDMKSVFEGYDTRWNRRYKQYVAVVQPADSILDREGSMIRLDQREHSHWRWSSTTQGLLIEENMKKTIEDGYDLLRNTLYNSSDLQ